MSKPYRTTLIFNPNKSGSREAQEHLNELRILRPDLSINDIMIGLLLEDANRRSCMTNMTDAVKKLTEAVDQLAELIRQIPPGSGAVTAVVPMPVEPMPSKGTDELLDAFGF